MNAKINIEFSKEIHSTHRLFHEDSLKKKYEDFYSVINNPNIGFFQLADSHTNLLECQKIYQDFKDRTHFIHVGIGGSSLGPEMLIKALRPRSNKRNFAFINNIDPSVMQETLENLNPQNAIFYFVSKSGGTAETMAAFCIITNWLKKFNITHDQYANYFVFATDPREGDLRNLAMEYSIPCLTVPKNVGGRFSVLTSVGLFPALFADISPEKILNGAKHIQPFLLNTSVQQNLFLKAGSFLQYLKVESGVRQTVLMPYSSRFREVSNWFVQLWAESLGKKKNRLGQVVYEGLTPISSVGATDQHSQLQLFMEGPKDKCILFLEIKKFKEDFSLENHFSAPSLKKLAPYTLSQLLKAELEGTIQGLKEEGRPYMRIILEESNEENLGALILFFESLTALMGLHLNIDPFDQPGVEASKIYAFKWLAKLGQQT